MTVLTSVQAALLEALVDERIPSPRPDDLPPEVVAELDQDGGVRAERRDELARALQRRAFERTIEWASSSVVQGEVLAAFADHCRDELDDISVEHAEPTSLVVRWRDEVSRCELRNGFVGVGDLVIEQPTMLLGDLEPWLDDLVAAFVDRPELRSRLALCDLGRLERLGTVRSSAFVYFEWFLRDAYGVKLLPSQAFTRGLIDRGVISLGMG
jgi:hypothetical protein